MKTLESDDIVLLDDPDRLRRKVVGGSFATGLLLAGTVRAQERTDAVAMVTGAEYGITGGDSAKDI
jgi:hypothetical protein